MCIVVVMFMNLCCRILDLKTCIETDIVVFWDGHFFFLLPTKRMHYVFLLLSLILFFINYNDKSNKGNNEYIVHMHIRQ